MIIGHHIFPLMGFAGFNGKCSLSSWAMVKPQTVHLVHFAANNPLFVVYIVGIIDITIDIARFTKRKAVGPEAENKY